MSFIKSKLQTAINNNMKNTFKTLLFISLLCGVSGADEMKSVMEGDSVTLQTDDTEILTYNLIIWWFEGDVIARISDEGKIKFFEDVADGRFRGRLKLDHQTGSLTITNTRTVHSGDYKIQIDTNTGRIEKTFTLTVYESPSVIDAGISDVKVMEGESVSLNTDIIKPHGDELIVWRFGDTLIAKDDKENNKTSLYPDERFKDRIHLDQTGSLIITDSRTAHTGEYKLKISSSSRDTKHKRFSLYVSDPPLSAGAKAGITVAVLLIVAAAAAVGVIYYRRRISELERQKEEMERQKEEQERLKDRQRTVSVMKGKSVPLITDDAHIKTDKVTVYHEQSPIAEISGGKITQVYHQISERYEPNHQTGSLIITDSRRSDAGLYELNIINSTKEKTFKRIIVTVVDEVIRKIVMEGNSVYLSSDVTELQEDAEVEWRFKNNIIKNIVIADKKQEHKMISLHQDADDFKQNLLVEQTGSLFITNSRMDQSGDYELNITSSRITVQKIFKVYVIGNESDDDGENESDGLMNNAADGVNEKQGTSSV